MMTVQRYAPTFTRRSTRFVVALFLLLFGSLETVSAQIEPITPTWMTVTRETPLRCGELSTFYKVADLNRATVVRVDGRSSRWARVIYPAGQFAFVRNEDATDVRDGTLTVEKANRIMAPNQISGLSGSWRSIPYTGDLVAGTRLNIIGPAESRDGQQVGYKVVPPMPPAIANPPYGYVQLAAVREATQPEIDAHLAALKPDPAADERDSESEESNSATAAEAEDSVGESEDQSLAEATSEPTSVLEPEDSDPEDQVRSEAEPAEAESAAADTSLIDDLAVPSAEELTDTPEDESSSQESTDAAVDATPAAESDQAANQSAEEVVNQNDTAATQAPAQSPEVRDYLEWSELESTLTSVRRQGGSVLAESLEELIAEYERSLMRSNTPAARSALGSRLEWLRVRKAARDQRLEIQATLEEAKELRDSVSRERSRWQSTKGHDMIGRLVTSAIYDGKRLPRMYRIVTDGESGLTRTIGYVRDDPKFDLDGMLGSIVGVSGSARLDEALRLRVITPSSIDRFRATGQP